MSTTTKAHRGDLVALVLRRSTVSIEAGRVEREAVEVREVTSITREGAVKATRRLDDPDGKPWPLDRELGLVQRYVIPAASIDVAGARAAVLAHVYEGHAQVKPFDSLEACRDAMRPHMLTKAQA